MLYVHKEILFSQKKKKRNVTLLITSMELEGVLLGEINPKEKGK